MRMVLAFMILFSLTACQDDNPVTNQNDYIVSLLNAKQYQKIINILEYKEQNTDNLMMLIEAHAGLAKIDIESTIKLIKILDSFKYDDFDTSLKDITLNIPKINDEQYSHLLKSLDLYSKLEKSIRNNNKDLNFKFMIIYVHKLVHDIHVFGEVQKSILNENRTVKQNINDSYKTLLLVAEDIFKIKVLGDYSYKKLSSLSSKLEKSLNKIVLRYGMVLEYPKNTENFYEFFTKTLEINEQFALLLSSIALYKKEDFSFSEQIKLILKNQENLNSNSKAILSVISKEKQDDMLNFLYNKQQSESEIVADFKKSIQKESETFLNYEMGDLIRIIKNNEKNLNTINTQL